MTLRITNLELALMTAISKSKFITGSGKFVWLSSVTGDLGSERNINKTIDSAISAGLIELETYPNVKNKGIKLTGFAERIMTAILKDGRS